MLNLANPKLKAIFEELIGNFYSFMGSFFYFLFSLLFFLLINEQKVVALYTKFSVFSGTIQVKKVWERKNGFLYSIQSEWRDSASLLPKVETYAFIICNIKAGFVYDGKNEVCQLKC